VAELLATGHEQRDIATALSLSPGRVSQLVNALRKKLPKF
jgi:DNA-binding CsgD family transcriptional regulator